MLSIPSATTPRNTQLRGLLVGSDRCTIPGFTATSSTPVLALCRTLLAAGFDPATPLECYRGETLALYVLSIGQAARPRVATHGVGFEPLPECTGAPPIEQIASEAVEIGDGR